MEIPVTPPSMKWLESKKPFRPKPAEKIPRKINRMFFNSDLKSKLLEAGNGIERINGRGYLE
ncbi:hypothetical protein ACD591_16090 [Rufibacter glacialis]|uniref:Uncharacterized protein n=1 Tax=Rufibacter glacialis TaxID=1259555 RepID=A0ABV4RKS8_9BACT|nr:hypothetical protein [Rufibacter glacialis]